MSFSNDIANLATKTLIREVMITPKPGLVDRDNTGAHTDMDIFTFLDSSFAITKYFENCISCGEIFKTTEKIFPILQKYGLEAELKMYDMTAGVNTHKGIIFSLGIICAAAGIIYGKKESFSKELLQKYSKQIAKDSKRDLDIKTPKTYGEKLYKEHGLKGARGEAISGFETIDGIYESYIEEKKHRQDEIPYIKALIRLMAKVNDSNIVGRKDISALYDIKSRAKDILDAKTDLEFIKKVKELDLYMIKYNLSPGGSADLLAVIIFIEELENYFYNLENRALKILDARENRRNYIDNMTKADTDTIISLKTNYCGDLKNGVLQDILFEIAKKELIKVFKLHSNTFIIEDTDDGKNLIAKLNIDPNMAKKLAVNLEENHKLGRLFDIDIYHDEKAISRKDLNLDQRLCIVCGNFARNCIRNRSHSEKTVLEITKNMILKYIRDDMD
ncbi:MAG: citrate lyase holo-[acyl-carrier protein] synthase [Tissierellia bacterium]|nr:citrate lyase holo-[acyl-carrier protein] synthase [Tissierellia bacterium]